LTTSRSRARSVTLGLPPGWVDRSVLTYVGPDDGEGSPSLVVTMDDVDGGTTLARYASLQDAAVRAGFEGIDLLDDRETTVAGHPAVRRTYRWRYDDRVMRQRMWCLLVDEVGYAIIASAPDADFDGLRGTFAAALRDFRVGPPD
jgi:hypothetical protein